MTKESERVSRRDLLRGAGAAALIGALHQGARADSPQKKPAAGFLYEAGPGPGAMQLTVNGQAKTVSAEPRTTLLEVLREHLGLTGAKPACDRGACGACTVWVDGKPQNACMTLALDAVGAKITTVEGLAADGALHPVQAAFVKHDALQCGFCTPGMVMSCAALARDVKKPTEQQMREAVAGNLCRCGTYPHVFSAMKEVTR